MTLKDIGSYKSTILNKILESEDIGKLMLGKNLNMETIDDDLLYKYVFPFLYVDNTQTTQSSYICVEVNVPRTVNFTFKDMKVVVWCYCHKGIMKYSHKGYRGTRCDILADMVDRLLNTSRDFGLGRLKLQSVDTFEPHKDYYGRVMVYSCTEFNVDKNL